MKINPIIFIVFLLGCEKSNNLGLIENIVPTEIFAPVSIEPFDIGNANDASDIRVIFIAGNNRLEIAEYRIFVVPSNNADSFTLKAAINEDNYFEYSSPSTLNKVNLKKDLRDTNGSFIREEKAYNLFILAIPKNEELKPKLSQRSNVIILTNDPLRDIYVGSRGTDTIELFDGQTGEHLKTFISSNFGTLQNPQEIIYHEEKEIFLFCGYGLPNIKKFSKNGKYLGGFTSGHTFIEGLKMNIGPNGNLFVAEWANTNSILEFDIETGKLLNKIIDVFFQVTDFAWDSENNLYAVSFSYYNNGLLVSELRKYDSNYNLIKRVFLNEKVELVNIWIDDLNNVFIMDRTSGVVNKYDNELNFIESFIITDTKIEGFAIRNNDLLICDWVNGKVNIYDYQSGKFIKNIIDSQKIQQANSITFGPDIRPE